MYDPHITLCGVLWVTCALCIKYITEFMEPRLTQLGHKVLQYTVTDRFCDFEAKGAASTLN